ncbi:MAG TPA: hypothetical protein VGQ73_06700 [Gemmatimonadales bacterium]|nr:hypothetical protein [Gemmatimonadales bacterium]
MVRKLVCIAACGLPLVASGIPARPAYPQGGKGFPPVEAAMRRVDFHVDETIVLQIDYLRGRLLATRAEAPVHFDNPRSFILEIDSADITLSARGMSELLNRYVFAYSGAPLKSLTITVEGKRLRQRGRVNGFPFNILSDVQLTPSGELRLRPVSIKAFGISVKGLLGLLGITLEKMMDLRKAKGVRAEKNDLVLSPTTILPPPTIRGHLARVELRDSAMVQVFRSEHGPVPPALVPPDSTAINYMYFLGGSLRFGNLTMTPADLLILDGDPKDRFDFYLGRYNDQLVAGFSRNTPSKGLITTMPDLRTLQSRGQRSGVRGQGSGVREQPLIPNP